MKPVKILNDKEVDKLLKAYRLLLNAQKILENIEAGNNDFFYSASVNRVSLKLELTIRGFKGIQKEFDLNIFE